MFPSTLIFSSAMSNLLLIPFSVFLSQTLYFSSLEFRCGSLFCLLCLYLTWTSFLSLLNIWETYKKYFNFLSCFYFLILININISSVFILIKWLFSSWGSFFFPATLHYWYFLLGSSHCEFYFAGCWMFYILVNSLELCLGMQLSNRETIWSFQVLLLRVINWGRAP